MCREFARASRQVLQLSQQGARDGALDCGWRLSLCPLLVRRRGRIDVRPLDVAAAWLLHGPALLPPFTAWPAPLPGAGMSRCCGEQRVALQGVAGWTLQVEELVQRAEWCRRYAQINSVGLRKV